MKTSRKRSILLSLLCLLLPALPAWAGSADPPARQRAPETRGGSPVKVYSGEAVVRVDHNDNYYVMIALDQRDGRGITDGIADLSITIPLLHPVLEPLNLRDASADVEVRPEGVRVLLHTEERELEFVKADVRPSPRLQKSSYRFQIFPDAVHLFVSSEQAIRTTLDAVQRGEADLKKQDSSDQPPQTENDSCTPACANTCKAGSCTVACLPERCATCTCLDDRTPLCGCN